jgi:peptide deformylase
MKKENKKFVVKIAEVLVQKGEECSDYLTRPLFQVNMRLFGTVVGYKKTVITMINHMKELMNINGFEDYPKLSGISGANIGVPWNVIVVRMSDKKDGLLVMINPVICKMSDKTITVQSNCGSLRLPEKIPVNRREWVEVSYFDELGKLKKQRFTIGLECGGTIQHEIDHNRGVLITDSNCHL